MTEYLKMAEYRISCADGEPVTLTVRPDDQIAIILRNLTRYHGLDPHHVLSQVLCNFTRANVLYDIDPGEIYNMLLAFWTGYEMADMHRDAG